MRIGYARVSTSQQSVQSQLDALKEAGCEKIFFDEGLSGKNTDRPGLQAALAYARTGDAITVARLDRLGRSLRDLVDLVSGFEEQGIELVSLAESIDTTSSTGRLVLGIFASLAEFERSLVRERTLAGLEVARRNGRVGGRPRALDDHAKNVVRALLKDESLTVKRIAEQVGCSPATIYRTFPGGKANQPDR